MPEIRLLKARTLIACLAVLLFTSCALLFPRQQCPANFKVDFKEALLFADKADLAYQSKDSVLRACGNDSCFVLEGSKTFAQGIVERDDAAKIQWVAFRGTATVSDAQLDVDYTQLPDSVLGIYLHSGFAAAAEDLLPGVIAVLKPGYQTNVSGHSLGGAIAVISALRLQKLGFKVKVRTYGQPKFTNFDGVAKIASLDLIRFIDDKDIVPLMPPLDWKPGQALGSFAHFGREINLRPQGFSCLERHYDDLRPEYLKSQWNAGAFKDHGLALYQAKLRVLAADSLR